MKKLLIIIYIFTTAALNGQIIATQNETFDPMTLNEPPLATMNQSDIYEIISDIHDYSYGKFSNNDYRITEMQGWKIQMHSTKNFYESDSIKQVVSTLFPQQEVVSVFNSPYYKIRLGNYQNRAVAEQTLRKARQQGFANSWIIPSRIKIKEKISN